MAPLPPVCALAKAMLVDGVDETGICLRFVRQLYGHDGVKRVGPVNYTPANFLHPFAAEAWTNAQVKHKPRAGSVPKAPPVGVPVWWTGAPSGHVAISAGGGYVVSTDWPHEQQVNKVAIKDLTQAWRKTYRGWTEDINDVTVFVTPEVRLAKVQAAAMSQVDDGSAPKACLIVNCSLFVAGLLGEHHAMDEHLSARAVHGYRKWQQRQGVAGTGVPDRRTLTKLGRKYGFTVV